MTGLSPQWDCSPEKVKHTRYTCRAEQYGGKAGKSPSPQNEGAVLERWIAFKVATPSLSGDKPLGSLRRVFGFLWGASAVLNGFKLPVVASLGLATSP